MGSRSARQRSRRSAPRPACPSAPSRRCARRPQARAASPRSLHLDRAPAATRHPTPRAATARPVARTTPLPPDEGPAHQTRLAQTRKHARYRTRCPTQGSRQPTNRRRGIRIDQHRARDLQTHPARQRVPAAACRRLDCRDVRIDEHAVGNQPDMPAQIQPPPPGLAQQPASLLRHPVGHQHRHNAGRPPTRPSTARFQLATNTATVGQRQPLDLQQHRRPRRRQHRQSPPLSPLSAPNASTAAASPSSARASASNRTASRPSITTREASHVFCVRSIPNTEHATGQEPATVVLRGVQSKTISGVGAQISLYVARRAHPLIADCDTRPPHVACLMRPRPLDTQRDQCRGCPMTRSWMGAEAFS